MPRKVIDSRDGENNTEADTEFVVFDDKMPIDFDEMPAQAREYNLIMGIAENPETHRTLVIPIPESAENVDIIGAWPI